MIIIGICEISEATWGATVQSRKKRIASKVQ